MLSSAIHLWLLVKCWFLLTLLVRTMSITSFSYLVKVYLMSTRMGREKVCCPYIPPHKKQLIEDYT